MNVASGSTEKNELNREHKTGETVESKKGPLLVSVVVDDALTPVQLAKMAKQRPLHFTPHVGNKWREDLYLIDLGCPTINFHENCSGLDVLDQPEKIKFDGEVYELASNGSTPTMTPYLQMTDLEKADPRLRKLVKDLEGRNPGHLHMLSTKKVLPGKPVKTFPEEFILGQDNKLLREMMAVFQEVYLADKNPLLNVFSRYVDSSGRMLKVKSGCSEFQLMRTPAEELTDLTREQVARAAQDYFDFSQKTNDVLLHGEAMPEIGSPIPRNEFRLLLTALKQMLDYFQDGGKIPVNEKGQFEAVLVSGPSMINYSRNKDVLALMSEYYLALKAIGKDRFGLPMPESVTLRMMPGAALSYLPVEGENDVLEAIDRLVPIEVVKKDLRSRLSRKEVSFQEVKEAISSNDKNEKKAVDDLTDAIRGAIFVSQYDLLRGKKLLSSTALEGAYSMPFKTHQMILEIAEKRAKK